MPYIQLKNGNTVWMSLEDYIDLDDDEFNDLMNSPYGYYVSNPYNKENFTVSSKFEELDEELDISQDDDN